MAGDQSQVNVNLGILSPLFLIFLVLKLTGFIAWSWWWVTAPLWLPFAIIIPLLLLGLGVAFLSKKV